MYVFNINNKQDFLNKAYAKVQLTITVWLKFLRKLTKIMMDILPLINISIGFKDFWLFLNIMEMNFMWLRMMMILIVLNPLINLQLTLLLHKNKNQFSFSLIIHLRNKLEKECGNCLSHSILIKIMNSVNNKSNVP